MKGLTPYQKSVIETWLLRVKVEPEQWTVDQALKSIEETFSQPLIEGEGGDFTCCGSDEPGLLHQKGSDMPCFKPQQESKEEPEIDGGVSVKKFKNGGWCITGFDNEMAGSVIRALSDIYIQKKEPSNKEEDCSFGCGEPCIHKPVQEPSKNPSQRYDEIFNEKCDELAKNGGLSTSRNGVLNLKINTMLQLLDELHDGKI